MFFQRIFLIGFLTAQVFHAKAQRHDYNWLFGYDNKSFEQTYWGGANLNFKNTPALIYPQKKKIDFDFYCGICSDSTGTLAFYTNGISIRDTTHNIMLNGDTINPGPIWSDWKNRSYPNGPFCFALPAPGKSNQYYFFHMATAFVPAVVTSPFYYTVVDMKGNNGLGVVTQKNQVLLPLGPDLLAPVAAKHGNGRDWWVITGEVSTPKIYLFLLDPDGVHGPFETDMPFQFPGQEFQSDNAMSPDGRTYVRCDGNHGLYIYDFDRCSGTLDNLRVLPFADEDFFGFAAVFAPNSRNLYISSYRAITVVDIKAPDPAASYDTLSYFDGQASPFEPFTTGFWNPNLGPDGKIYYATTSSTLSMHVIHSPNLPGHSADMEQHGLALPKLNDGTMCLFPNYRLGEWEGSPCDTLNFQHPNDGFVKTDYYPPAYAKTSGYVLLPPIGGSPGGQRNNATPKVQRPSMAEIALQRLQAERKEQERRADNDAAGKQ